MKVQTVISPGLQRLTRNILIACLIIGSVIVAGYLIGVRLW